ncbi:MAG: replication initiator protein A, partial [gamma proteobacterium symbiont of Lucinoma myriamae]|nr:replication initiator protein A [gamma proteobacterium symbiont of Lucinoma myriamae]
MDDKMKNIKSILGEVVTEEKGLVNANKLRDKLELDHKEKKEKSYKKKRNSFQKDLIKTEKKQVTKRKFEKNSKLEQLDMFSAVIVDASVKDDAATMSVQFFSLSKVKDDVPRTYKDENGGDILKLEPSGRGLATIWDKDILLFCMSQIMSAINKKQKISQTLKIDTYSVLTTTNRGCGRGSYENIEDALIRLRGTTIMTSI